MHSTATTRAAAPGLAPARRGLPGARTGLPPTPARVPAPAQRARGSHRRAFPRPSAQPRPLESTPILHAGPPLRPTLASATAFAPATIANLGPGFDWLGCAVDGAGDTVTVVPLPGKAGLVEIASITGDGGRLPLDGATNCCGVAAAHTLRLLGNPDVGVRLTIDKVWNGGEAMGERWSGGTRGMRCRPRSLMRRGVARCDAPYPALLSPSHMHTRAPHPTLHPLLFRASPSVPAWAPPPPPPPRPPWPSTRSSAPP